MKKKILLGVLLLVSTIAFTQNHTTVIARFTTGLMFGGLQGWTKYGDYMPPSFLRAPYLIDDTYMFKSLWLDSGYEVLAETDYEWKEGQSIVPFRKRGLIMMGDFELAYAQGAIWERLVGYPESGNR